MPAFVLTLGKGKPKLKEADGSGNTGCQPQQQKAEPGTIPYAMISCHNLTMEQFARNLRFMRGAYMTNPVVDSTGLKDPGISTLSGPGGPNSDRPAATAISIFDAVDKTTRTQAGGAKGTIAGSDRRQRQPEAGRQPSWGDTEPAAGATGGV